MKNAIVLQAPSFFDIKMRYSLPICRDSVGCIACVFRKLQILRTPQCYRMNAYEKQAGGGGGSASLIRNPTKPRLVPPIHRNKSATGAYYLAGGGPCIATDAGTSSPLGGNTARSVGRRYCRAARRHLQRRLGKWPVLLELTRGLQELMGRLQELMGRGPAWWPGRLPGRRARPMGACGATSTGWRRYG